MNKLTKILLTFRAKKTRGVRKGIQTWVEEYKTLFGKEYILGTFLKVPIHPNCLCHYEPSIDVKLRVNKAQLRRKLIKEFRKAYKRGQLDSLN